LQELAMRGELDKGLKVRPLCLPDTYIEQAVPEAMYKLASLDAAGIAQAALIGLGRPAESAKARA
jgi:1-deoxy-D-xylulose-5-phosphate synthase